LSADPIWRAPPRGRLTLSNDAVHVWRASLAADEAAVVAFADTLSAEERERAERFRTGDLATRFVAGRGNAAQDLLLQLRQVGHGNFVRLSPAARSMPDRDQAAGNAAFAFSTIALKAAGSAMARSDSTLRSTITPALASPSMKRL